MGKKLVYIQIVLLFIIGIQEMFVNSKSMQYLLDINLLIILMYCIIDRQKEFFYSIQLLKTPLIFMLLLFTEGGMSLFRSGIDFIQFFWEVRTLFRFPLFLICCVTLLNKKDVFKMNKYFPYVFYLNFLFSLYHKYVLNMGWDNIGGIFGTTSGVNGDTVIFLSIYFVFRNRDFVHKSIPTYKFVIDIMIIAWIVLFAELKIMFFLLPLIAFVQSLMTKFNYKKIVVFSLAMIVTVGLVSIYGNIYKESSFDFSQHAIETYSSNGYGGRDDDVVDRATAFNVIDKLFYEGTNNNRWLGIGMGVASDSQIFASNGFYDRWRWIHYEWFMHSFMYLENGIIGVILYLSFWTSILYKFWNLKKNRKEFLSKVSFSIVVVALICFFYNSSLRWNSAYLLYLCISIPFLSLKNGTSIFKINLERIVERLNIKHERNEPE